MNMTTQNAKCPICGGAIIQCPLDNLNLDFLEKSRNNGKINAAVSLGKDSLEQYSRTKTHR